MAAFIPRFIQIFKHFLQGDTNSYVSIGISKTVQSWVKIEKIRNFLLKPDIAPFKFDVNIIIIFFF